MTELLENQYSHLIQIYSFLCSKNGMFLIQQAVDFIHKRLEENTSRVSCVQKYHGWLHCRPIIWDFVQMKRNHLAPLSEETKQNYLPLDLGKRHGQTSPERFIISFRYFSLPCSQVTLGSSARFGNDRSELPTTDLVS